MTGETEPINGMGYLLDQELNNDMISIGAAFNEGEFQDWNRSFEPAPDSSFEGQLTKLDYDYFILDIRDSSKNDFVPGILSEPQVIRGQDFEMTTIPNKSFDAFFFTKNITRVMPCPASLEKYRNMN